MRALVALLGPTASGKSDIALEAARRTGATILSVDSMQVYRRMDIGTAKPTREERASVPHLMIDVVEPSVDYTAAEFQRDARKALEEVDGPVLVVGGSGLHFRAVVDPLEFPPGDPDVRADVQASTPDSLVAELLAADPAAAELVDVENPRRLVRAVEILRVTGLTPSERANAPAAVAVREYRPFYPLTALGIDAGPTLEARIRSRVLDMRHRGLLEEVEGLEAEIGRLASQAVGYRELLEVVRGAAKIEPAFERIVETTRRLAKRQRTFFRRDPRIRWLSGDTATDEVAAALEGGVT